MFLCAFARAQTTTPTDLSPRETMKALEAAAARGDSATLLTLIQTSTATESKFVQAYADNSAAQHALRQAIAARFPTDAKAGDDSIAQQLKGINSTYDKLDETISGDSASLSPAGAPPGARLVITFKRINGRWVLPFDSMFPGSANLDTTADTLNTMSAVLRGIAADTLAGRFATMDELKQAGESRMTQATLDARSASRPASRPSTAPSN